MSRPVRARGLKRVPEVREADRGLVAPCLSVRVGAMGRAMGRQPLAFCSP